MSGLLDDLADAEAGKPVTTGLMGRPCRACEVIADAPDDEREALSAALAGSIGRDRLATILEKHGTPVGRWIIDRHRREGH